MLRSRKEPSPATTGALSGTHLRVDDAGGVNRRFVLAAEYLPRSGKRKKTIKSNNCSYGKSWATRDEISPADREAFVNWINTKLATGGGSRQRTHPKELRLASRSSLRVNNQMASVCTHVADVVVERGVAQCLKFLVDNVVHLSRHGGVNKVNYVPGKRGRHKTCTRGAEMGSRSWGAGMMMTSRMSRAARLTQRKRESKGYEYRSNVLKAKEARRLENDLEWLQEHEERLATIAARQCLHELLPEGEAIGGLHLAVPMTYPFFSSQVTTLTRNFFEFIARHWSYAGIMSC